METALSACKVSLFSNVEFSFVEGHFLILRRLDLRLDCGIVEPLGRVPSPISDMQNPKNTNKSSPQFRFHILMLHVLEMPTILYPYTAERRDVLGNTSPEAREISRGRGFCTSRAEG